MMEYENFDYQTTNNNKGEKARRTTSEKIETFGEVLSQVCEVVKPICEMVVVIGNSVEGMQKIVAAPNCIKATKNKSRTAFLKSKDARKRREVRSKNLAKKLKQKKKGRR